MKEEPEGNTIAHKAEQTLRDLGNTAANQAADLAQQTDEQLRHVGEQAQAAAETLAGQGQQKLSDPGQQTADKLDHAARRASDVLHTTAEGLRSHAPEQGRAGEITQQVVEGLEQSSSFLEEQSRKGVVAQTTNLVLVVALLASLAGVVVVLLAWLGSRRQ